MEEHSLLTNKIAGIIKSNPIKMFLLKIDESYYSNITITVDTLIDVFSALSYRKI